MINLCIQTLNEGLAPCELLTILYLSHEMVKFCQQSIATTGSLDGLKGLTSGDHTASSSFHSVLFRLHWVKVYSLLASCSQIMCNLHESYTVGQCLLWIAIEILKKQLAMSYKFLLPIRAITQILTIQEDAKLHNIKSSHLWTLFHIRTLHIWHLQAIWYCVSVV